MENSLDRLVSLPPIEKTYFKGSLLILPLSEKLVKETNYIELEKIINPQQNQEFISKVRLLSKSEKYPKQLTRAAPSLIDLAQNVFSELARSQKLSQSSVRSDRYYALPIQTFIALKALGEYFETTREEGNRL